MIVVQVVVGIVGLVHENNNVLMNPMGQLKFHKHHLQADELMLEVEVVAILIRKLANASVAKVEKGG